MDEWINLIVFIIFGAVALLTRILGRKDSKTEPDTTQEDDEITLPPWGNLPMEEDAPLPEFIEEEAPSVQPEPTSAVQVASASDLVDEETPAQPPPVRQTIAGIPLTPQTFRQGIILAEILRPPKSLREPRQ